VTTSADFRIGRQQHRQRFVQAAIIGPPKRQVPHASAKVRALGSGCSIEQIRCSRTRGERQRVERAAPEGNHAVGVDGERRARDRGAAAGA
jgi:hypothetical protein